MATRRCISKDIYTQRRFLELSPTTRDLYTYLVLFSDIDGITEAYSVMKMINATATDLRNLDEEGYIKVLNDEWVTYISDFTSFNTLDGRDMKGSKYRELLVKTIPNVRLVELKKKKSKKPPEDSHGNPVTNETKQNINKHNYNNAFNSFTQRDDYDIPSIEAKLTKN